MGKPNWLSSTHARVEILPTIEIASNQCKMEPAHGVCVKSYVYRRMSETFKTLPFSKDALQRVMSALSTGN